MRPAGYYENLYRTMTVLPDWEARAARAGRIIQASELRYSGYAVPWQYIGVIHYLECGADFGRQILNGQRWDRQTTLVPIGLGPWFSWHHSTMVALKRRRIRGLADIERWNGTGYEGRGLHSPYLWSGSNHGVGVGKYTKDGPAGYDPAAVSKQIGAAVLLHALSGGDLAMVSIGGA